VLTLCEARLLVKVSPRSLLDRTTLTPHSGVMWCQNATNTSLRKAEYKVSRHPEARSPHTTATSNRLHKGMPLQQRFLSLCLARAAPRLPRTSSIKKLTPSLQLPPISIPQHVIFKSNMSSGFSNADTGSKNADPYTQKNLEEPSLKEKVEDLLNFVDQTKFCLLTTQTADSDLLASRAMAVAARVGNNLSRTLTLHTY
jgi:hypothetical protein